MAGLTGDAHRLGMQTKPLIGRLASASFPVFIVALASGCAPGFSGNWTCNIQSTTTYSAPAGAPDYNGSGSFTMDVTDDGSSVVETRTNGGVGPTCPIHFTLG